MCWPTQLCVQQWVWFPHKCFFRIWLMFILNLIGCNVSSLSVFSASSVLRAQLECLESCIGMFRGAECTEVRIVSAECSRNICTVITRALHTPLYNSFVKEHREYDILPVCNRQFHRCFIYLLVGPKFLLLLFLLRDAQGLASPVDFQPAPALLQPQPLLLWAAVGLWATGGVRQSVWTHGAPCRLACWPPVQLPVSQLAPGMDFLCCHLYSVSH